jgi:hypothetical protein
MHYPIPTDVTIALSILAACFKMIWKAADFDVELRTNGDYIHYRRKSKPK